MSERSSIRRRLRAFVIDLKERTPCIDCIAVGLTGTWPHEAMQFDHVPGRGAKVGTINVFVQYGDELGLLAEIAKCEIVCANHHATRSKQRGKSPETIAKMVAAGKSRMASPEARARVSAAARRLWDDPNFKMRAVASMSGAKDRKKRRDENP